MEGKILKATEAVIGSSPSYNIDYVVESTRGKNHYSVKAAIKDKKLFVFTVQAKDADFPSLEEKISTIMESLVII